MFIKTKKSYRSIVFLGLLFIAESSLAYEIGPLAENGERPSFGNVNLGVAEFEKNHEKLTALSLICLAEANRGESDLVVRPERCSRVNASSERLNNLFSDVMSDEEIPKQIRNYSDLISYVRWPDDPTRFIHNNKKSAGKFVGLTKGDGCKKLKEESGGSLNLSEHGLFCNSHYGKLQFLHSMAERDGVERSVTMSKIKEWINFAYGISIGELDHTVNYCDFWEKNEKFPYLSKLMYEEKFREYEWCSDRNTLLGKLFGKPDTKAWTVGTTFNLECSNPVSSRNCVEILSDERENKIKRSSLGSIIHLVQDSYSRSHSERGSHDDIYPEAYCKSVKLFRSYSNQNADKHGVSDKWPSMGWECKDSTIYDPITAVANIIWLVHNNDKTDAGINSIVEGVFGSHDNNSVSEAGQFYE